MYLFELHPLGSIHKHQPLAYSILLLNESLVSKMLIYCTLTTAVEVACEYPVSVQEGMLQ